MPVRRDFKKPCGIACSAIASFRKEFLREGLEAPIYGEITCSARLASNTAITAIFTGMGGNGRHPIASCRIHWLRFHAAAGPPRDRHRR
jgi:hypothetical protein